MVFYDLNIKSMLDSRQRAELEELKKFLSSRQIWARIGLFTSCLISFSANGMFEKIVKAVEYVLEPYYEKIEYLYYQS